MAIQGTTVPGTSKTVTQYTTVHNGSISNLITGKTKSLQLYITKPFKLNSYFLDHTE